MERKGRGKTSYRVLELSDSRIVGKSGEERRKGCSTQKTREEGLLHRWWWCAAQGSGCALPEVAVPRPMCCRLASRFIGLLSCVQAYCTQAQAYKAYLRMLAAWIARAQCAMPIRMQGDMRTAHLRVIGRA